MTFELKLAGGKVVVWDGADGLDACRAYAASHPEATVIAWRTKQVRIVEHFAERMDHVSILEPGDRGWGR